MIDTQEDPEPVEYSADVCATEKGVVGHRRCPYGVWGVALEEPYIFMSIGVNMRHLPPVSRPRDTLARSINSSTTPDPDSETSYTIAQRFAVGIGSLLYGGVETEMAPATAEPAEPGTRTFAAGAQLLLGLNVGTKLFQLGGEVGGGVRLVDVAGDFDPEEQLVLEARGRLDVWLTPWLTIGGSLGTSLIDQGDWLAGLHLGVHSHAFGGH